MDDWGDNSTTTSAFGGGIGRGRGNPFGKGIGRARGRRLNGQESTFGQPSDTWGGQGSFGAKSNGMSNGGSTFGAPSGGSTFGAPGGGASNGFGGGDDDWNEGGSKGFGADGDVGGGGFKKSTFGMGGGGGGRSSGGGGGSRACFKCGEEGHMSRECPSSGGGGGGGSRACFKCGEEGHMSRECPSSGGGGGGGSRACFKCGEEGHMSRECPSGGGGGGGSRACFKCGEEGHMSRECPSGGGGGGGSRACFKCGEEGHMSRECPSGGGSSGGGGRGTACFKCGEEGHMSRECPTGGGDNACFKCKEEGHMARDCPNAPEDEKPREIYVPPPPPEDEESIFSSMQKGINFDKYDDIPVEVTGDAAPTRGISNFEEADLSQLFRDNVRKAKYERPTPVQKWAIPIIRKGRDLMACAQTGSGKTAAFLLPVLTGMVEAGCGGGQYDPVQKPMALVIGPTRELVIQIFNEARKFSHGSVINPVVVYGGTSVNHQSQQLSRGANIVIGTPGRLDDFITRGKISLENVKYLILDEADRMLDMGFEPVVRKIVEKNMMPGKGERQTLMFSATFPDEIQRLARDFLERYLFVTVGRVGSACTDISQTVFEVEQYGKRDKLVELLNGSGNDRVLVFVETKRNADFLASYLSQSEFPTTSIHGDRLQREREEALADFKKGRAPILVATSVAARGLDIPGVMHVVNYDLPNSIDEYVHRIGRTGRCGNLGKATSFFDSSKDRDLARSLVKVLEDAQQEVPSFLEQAAEEGTGTGFGGVGGAFGGRDTRRGKFGGGGGGGFGDDAGGDFGGGFSNAAEEESWD